MIIKEIVQLTSFSKISHEMRTTAWTQVSFDINFQGIHCHAEQNEQAECTDVLP